MIGTDGEREPGKSMLSVQLDDNMCEYIYIYIYNKYILDLYI